MEEEGGATQGDAGGEEVAEGFVDASFLLAEAGGARSQGKGVVARAAAEAGDGAAVGGSKEGTEAYDFRTEVRISVETGAVVGHAGDECKSGTQREPSLIYTPSSTRS